MRISRLTAVSAAVVLLAALGSSQGAHAGPAGQVATNSAAAPFASTESVSRLRVQATVTSASLVKMAEAITYDFSDNRRHGILRDIPLRYRDGKGTTHVLRINVTGVTRDGSPEQYTQSRGTELNLRIGNPNKLITGKHTYVITYTVHGALQATSNGVEFYWDFAGTNSSIETRNVTAKVRGPSKVLSAQCFQGEAGSTEACPVESDGTYALYGPTNLGPQEGMTGLTVFDASGFITSPTT